MNLQKIQQSIERFKDFLKSPKALDALYKYESLLNFQTNWNLEEPDLTKMYDSCLQNQQTVKLWKGEQYYPKQMMLLFCKMQPDYVRQAFTELFDESKDIGVRIDRFMYYGNELLAEYRNQNPLKVENNHYHDQRIISLYLAFRYPDQYAPYDFKLFQKSLTILGSRDIPKLNDVERYFKVSRTLSKFLFKDEKLIQLHKARLNPRKHYDGESLILVEEFCEIVVKWGKE